MACKDNRIKAFGGIVLIPNHLPQEIIGSNVVFKKESSEFTFF